MLQFKPSSGSDNDWTTLMSYYNDQTLFGPGSEEWYECRDDQGC